MTRWIDVGWIGKDCVCFVEEKVQRRSGRSGRCTDIVGVGETWQTTVYDENNLPRPGLFNLESGLRECPQRPKSRPGMLLLNEGRNQQNIGKWKRILRKPKFYGKGVQRQGSTILNLRGALGVAFIHPTHRAEPSLATPADQVFGMNGSKAILLLRTSDGPQTRRNEIQGRRSGTDVGKPPHRACACNGT